EVVFHPEELIEEFRQDITEDDETRQRDQREAEVQRGHAAQTYFPHPAATDVDSHHDERIEQPRRVADRERNGERIDERWQDRRYASFLGAGRRLHGVRTVHQHFDNRDTEYDGDQRAEEHDAEAER